MKKYQLLLLGFVFYYSQTYNYNIICAKCNKMQLFDPEKFKDLDLYNYHRVRSERGIKAPDYNINSNDLIKKSRVPRGVKESKNHLRLGDAHQIANYFISGGPLKGHDHFRGSSNCDSNNTETDTVGMSNPTSENETDSSVNEENPSENEADSSVNEENPSTNEPDPIIGAAHIPVLPETKPIVQPPNLLKSPESTPPLLSSLIPQIPQHSFLGSILHPRFHPHINTLHNIPSALVKAASMPVHGLLQAQSHLHDILKPRGITRGSDLLGSTNNIHESDTPLSDTPTNPQPAGYIVKYVPHNDESEPSSPTLDATEQEATDNSDS